MPKLSPEVRKAKRAEFARKAKASAARFLAGAPSLITNATGLFGGWLISKGAGEIYHPAGAIVGGVLLVIAVLLTTAGAARTQPKDPR